MIGIVVLNYNTYEDVFLCVESIRKFTSIEYKIYVVDNDSSDNSSENLLAKYRKEKDLVLIQSKSNCGYSAGNNIGIKYALQDKADAVVIINSDVVLKNQVFDLMYSVLKSDENIVVVGPSIEGPGIKEAQMARRKLDYKDLILGRHPFCNIKFLQNGLKREYDWKNQKEKIFKFSGMVSGCCFIFDIKLIDKDGLFDENVFLYYEEDILAYKLETNNYKTAICREAKIFHNHSHSVSKQGAAFTRYHRWLSSLYVIRKYGNIKGFRLFYIVFTNIITWCIFSMFDKNYRLLLKSFYKKNLSIFKT